MKGVDNAGDLHGSTLFFLSFLFVFSPQNEAKGDPQPSLVNFLILLE